MVSLALNTTLFNRELNTYLKQVVIETETLFSSFFSNHRGSQRWTLLCLQPVDASSDLKLKCAPVFAEKAPARKMMKLVLNLAASLNH